MALLPFIKLTPEQMEQRRLAALTMLRAGKSQAEIATKLSATSGAVSRWAKAAREGGARALKRRPHTGRKPKLSDSELQRIPELLLEGAQEHGFESDVWTLERVATLIKNEFGKDYHPHHVSKLLHKLGFTWKKPRRHAIKRDDEAINTWIKEEWPRLKNGRRSSEQ